MKIRNGLLGLVATLAIVVALLPEKVASQVFPGVSLYGRFNSAAKALTATTDGYLNVKVQSGSITDAFTVSRNGIATTSTDGFVAQNATAATAGVPVQQSPRIRLRSNVWNTTVTAANNTNDWVIESVPVSGTTPSGLLKFGSSLNGAAYTFPMTLTSGGGLSVNAAGSMYAGAYWFKRADTNADYAALYQNVGADNKPEVKMYASGGDQMVFNADPTSTLRFGTAYNWAFVADAGLILTNATNSIIAQFVAESSDAVAMRRSTNAQTFRLYNTYTNASTYQRWALDAATSGTLTIKYGLNGAADTSPMTLTSAGALSLGNGTATLPSVAFAASTGTGFYSIAANAVGVSEGTGLVARFGAGYGLSLLSNASIYGLWFGATAVAPDVGLLRRSASILSLVDSNATGPVGFVLGLPGGVTSSHKLTKKVTGIADNTATDVLTVTIPNGNHAATVKLIFTSSNGSTDAFESTRTSYGQVGVARTTGANAVATAATLGSTAIATVAAGATHTFAYNVSAIAGAVGDSNTFTIQVTIDDSGNLGGNQVVVLAELVNAEATGITIQ